MNTVFELWKPAFLTIYSAILLVKSWREWQCSRREKYFRIAILLVFIGAMLAVLAWLVGSGSEQIGFGLLLFYEGASLSS